MSVPFHGICFVKLPSFCLTQLLPIVRELVGFPDPVVYEVDREVMASGLGGGGGGAET
jgi:hypothetical protein